MNDRAAAVAGRAAKDLMGKVVWDEFEGLESSFLGTALRNAKESGEVQKAEDYYAPLNRWLHANVYPSSDGLSVFIQDVSEKRRQQEKLLVTEKLAATGRLAATIAHEINNPLESVMNLLYLARISRSAAPETIQQYLQTAEQELTRVSQIARHTLGFYRETSVPTQVNLERVLDEVLTVYHSRLQANNIEVIRDFQTAPHLQAIRGEIHQIFSNLVSNSIDAMQRGGHLRVRLCEQRRGIEVVVEDTGSGISSEHLEKLFEPFFTTKASVGTGLGLWVVKQFVEQHGGAVTVKTDTGPINHGTIFTILLPLSLPPALTKRVM